MAKIKAPNKEYTGTVGTVGFSSGVGYTEDPYLISWFARKGYGIESQSEDSDDLKAQIKRLPTTVGEVDVDTPEEESFIRHLGRPAEDAEATKALDDETRAKVSGPGVGKLVQIPGSAPQIMRGTGSGGSEAEVLDPEQAAKELLEARGFKVTATGAEAEQEAQEEAAKAESKSTAKKTTAKKSTAKKRTQRGGGA